MVNARMQINNKIGNATLFQVSWARKWHVKKHTLTHTVYVFESTYVYKDFVTSL